MKESNILFDIAKITTSFRGRYSYEIVALKGSNCVDVTTWGFRGLTITENAIAPRSGPHFLSTALLNCLIQRATPSNLPNEVLVVGSANAFSFFEAMKKKKVE